MMRGLLTLAALMAPMPALAHPGLDHVHGFAAGVMHPLGGLDHVLAMVAVGLWAGLMGGRARLVLPLGFLGGMALGGVLGMAGVAMPMVEGGILASIIVLGALAALAMRLPAGTALPMVALFGLLHGHVHGTGVAGGAAASYALGFLLATAALHVAGLALGRQHLFPRIAGAATAAAGIVLIFM